MKTKFLYTIFLMTTIFFAVASAFAEEDSISPKSPREKRMEKRGKLFGEKSFNLFGNSTAKEGESSAMPKEKAMNVNSYLWQASLDVISFMPLTITDTAGGVISTDWHEDPDYPEQRYKINIIIKSHDLTPNALQVNVFKQELKDQIWRGVKANPKISEDIENKIFTRARELKLATHH